MLSGSVSGQSCNLSIQVRWPHSACLRIKNLRVRIEQGTEIGSAAADKLILAGMLKRDDDGDPYDVAPMRFETIASLV